MKKQKVKSSWKHDFKMNRSLYLLTIPVVAYFLIFNYAPMFGLVIAFEDFKPARGIIGSRWVGLKNFIDFFSGPSFGMILRNTFVINLLGLVIGFPMTIIFALQLNEISKKWVKKSVQTLSYLPYFVSMVVMCGLVIEFCSTNGIITDLMVKIFHIERENLLQNP